MAYLSGTSMSSPHVAGVLALLMANTAQKYTAATLNQMIVSLATSGHISGLPTGSNNRILFNSPPVSLLEESLHIQLKK